MKFSSDIKSFKLLAPMTLMLCQSWWPIKKNRVEPCSRCSSLAFAAWCRLTRPQTPGNLHLFNTVVSSCENLDDGGLPS